MDIVQKRAVKGGNGNAGSEFSDIIARAGSWQYGADTSKDAIQGEAKEEDLKFGVPNE
jgi:VCBS repeat-containing protein